MSDSEKEFNEELISAYLDGELDDRERERVERVLSEDIRYRRTCDELRGLRENLRSLPRFQLGPEFQAKVLQQVEPLMRDGRAPTADTSSIEPSTASPSDASVTRPARNWRGVVWAALTVAAALLIMLSVPSLRDEPNVAIAPEESSDAESIEGPPFSQDALPSPQSERSGGQRKEIGDDLRPMEDEKADGANTGFAEVGALPASPEGREIAGTREPGALGMDRARPKSPVNAYRLRDADTTKRESSQSPKTSVDQLQRFATDSFSTIVPDRESAGLIASAMQQTGAEYLVHVVAAKADEGSQALGRSLTRNEIQFEAESQSDALARRAMAPSLSAARTGAGPDAWKGFAYRLDSNQTARQVTIANRPQLVVVRAAPERFLAMVNELAERRDEFSTVSVYEVQDNAPSPVERLADKKQQQTMSRGAKLLAPSVELQAVEVTDGLYDEASPRPLAEQLDRPEPPLDAIARNRRPKRETTESAADASLDSVTDRRQYMLEDLEKKPTPMSVVVQPDSAEGRTEDRPVAPRASEPLEELEAKEGERHSAYGRGRARRAEMDEAWMESAAQTTRAETRAAVPVTQRSKARQTFGESDEAHQHLRLRRVGSPSGVPLGAVARVIGEKNSNGSHRPVRVLLVLSSPTQLPSVTVTEPATSEVESVEVTAPRPARPDGP